MDLSDPLMLARLQFAFTISFHIIFPAFSIGLASYLAVLEGAVAVDAAAPSFLDLFNYWKKIFAVAFGMGVVSGIVMSYQFGTNWSVFSDKAGPGARPADGLRGALGLLPRGGLPRRHAVRPASASATACTSSPRRWWRSARFMSAFWILVGQQLDADARPATPSTRPASSWPRTGGR